MRPYLFSLLIFSSVNLSRLTLAEASLKGRDLLNKSLTTIAPGARGTAVIFLSARCPCSDSHLDRVRGLKKDFSAFAFVVIHANSDEPAHEARAYFAKAALPMPILEDADGALADRFKASRTPHAFVVSHAGETVYRGGITDSTDGRKASLEPLRDALVDITAGRKVRRGETRALGCAISRGPHVE